MEFEMSQLPPTAWVTIEAVMEHLQVKSKNTITRWIRDGMPAHRIGKSYRFDLTEIDQWVRACSGWSRRAADERAS